MSDAIREMRSAPSYIAAGETMSNVRPGDLLRCVNCGAEAIASTTRPDRWREGDTVLLTWPTGLEASRVSQERCPPCHSRFMALGKDTPPSAPPGPRRDPPPAGITLAKGLELAATPEELKEAEKQGQEALRRAERRARRDQFELF